MVVFVVIFVMNIDSIVADLVATTVFVVVGGTDAARIVVAFVVSTAAPDAAASAA